MKGSKAWGQGRRTSQAETKETPQEGHMPVTPYPNSNLVLCNQRYIAILRFSGKETNNKIPLDSIFCFLRPTQEILIRTKGHTILGGHLIE